MKHKLKHLSRFCCKPETPEAFELVKLSAEIGGVEWYHENKYNHKDYKYLIIGSLDDVIISTKAIGGETSVLDFCNKLRMTEEEAEKLEDDRVCIDMELTGKCKEGFESYYLYLPNSMGLNYGNRQTTLNKFYSLPLSMQFGVVQDYADSIGYELYVDKNTPFIYGWGLFDLIKEIDSGDVKTRDEARKSAIKAFDEIVNRESRKVNHK